jgi:hypothetical protein
MNPFDRNYNHNDEFKDHSVFSTIEEYIGIYEILSVSSFRYLNSIKSSTFNIDSYLFSSASNTLRSIESILLDGSLGDAYSLLRKYYDFLAISIFINIAVSTDSSEISKIERWVKGVGEISDFKYINSKIKNYSQQTGLSVFFNIDDYIKIRKRCNHDLHYGSYKAFLNNDNELFTENRVDRLDLFERDINNLFLFHFTYILYVSEHYISSSDYVDCLDMNMTPPENSQYWVIPKIQETFEKLVKIKNPNLAKFLKANSSMEIK